MAAKKVNIDWDRVSKLLNAQCSGTGIAAVLGIHENTLYSRCKTDQGMEFMAFAAIKKGEGLELLRDKQFNTALKGNVIMQIWLGKQYLGQKDKSDLTSGNEKIQPLTINVTSPENVDKYKKYLEKIGQLN